jgi:hypothetical protein
MLVLVQERPVAVDDESLLTVLINLNEIADLHYQGAAPASTAECGSPSDSSIENRRKSQ